MAWTDALVQLQEIDLELEENQQRLAEIAARLADSAAVQRAKALVSRRHEVAEQARRDQETLEFELNQVQMKQQHAERNLYSGRVTNARELQDLQAENQSLKRRIATLEDRLLEAMMARETADQERAAAQSDLEELQASRAAEDQQLTEERGALTARNEELAGERAQVLEQIPASVLDSYDYLRGRVGNRPVSQTRGHDCGICGVRLTSATRQKVEHRQEAYCDGCRRLIVRA